MKHHDREGFTSSDVEVTLCLSWQLISDQRVKRGAYYCLDVISYRRTDTVHTVMVYCIKFRRLTILKEIYHFVNHGGREKKQISSGFCIIPHFSHWLLLCVPTKKQVMCTLLSKVRLRTHITISEIGFLTTKQIMQFTRIRLDLPL